MPSGCGEPLAEDVAWTAVIGASRRIPPTKPKVIIASKSSELAVFIDLKRLREIFKSREAEINRYEFVLHVHSYE